MCRLQTRVLGHHAIKLTIPDDECSFTVSVGEKYIVPGTIKAVNSLLCCSRFLELSIDIESLKAIKILLIEMCDVIYTWLT